MTRVEAEIPDWQRRILDERLHDLERSPADEVSLAEARTQFVHLAFLVLPRKKP
jgi:TPP-dependent trihydroxycyclohexane-1,2-dione (THcHDO) dehydratase